MNETSSIKKIHGQRRAFQLICVYIFILAIPGKTAGPNWLNFFKELMGARGVI